MDTKIIDGRVLAQDIRLHLKEIIPTLPKKPVLAVVLIGDNPASKVYVEHKLKAAAEVGIDVEFHHLSAVTDQQTAVQFVRDLNKQKDIDAILLQLPLPAGLDSEAVLQEIDPAKDADGLHYVNLGKLFAGHPDILPCTPQGCMALIKSVCPKLEGLNAVVIGRSNLVGRPLAQLLLDENCTVLQAHSKTKNLASLTCQADILVSATGQCHLVGKEFVKKGAVVIDVGITRDSNGRLCGDVDFNALQGWAGAVTPVPGGVGPMTIAMLLQNVVQIVQKKACQE